MKKKEQLLEEIKILNDKIKILEQKVKDLVNFISIRLSNEKKLIKYSIDDLESIV